MAQIYWDDSLLTGDAAIDEEHKLLFFVANNLEDNVQGAGIRIRIPTYVDILKRYAFKHFANEERLMQESGYADMDMHLEEHKLFREGVDEFLVRAEKGDVELEEIRDFVLGWLQNHIRATDKKLVKALKR